MAADAGTLVIRNTFLEVFDEEAATDGSGVRRGHSAPPSIEARRKECLSISDEPIEFPKHSSSSVLYDSPMSKRSPTGEMSKIPSMREQEEWLAGAAADISHSHGDGTDPAAEEADAEAELAEEGIEGRDISTMTTVILRNVPNSYTRDDLLDFLDSHGFYGRYDFLYLPVKFGSSCAFGYALINLLDHEDARRFQAYFHNFSSWSVPCSNTASVSWSKAHQGLAEHVERYRNSPMMHASMPDECKPIILRNGVRVPFPPPTKKAPDKRRTERTRNARRKESGASRGAPGSVSSLASEASYSSDHWKAPSVSSGTGTTPAGSSPQPAEPTSSPLFQGLTWLGGVAKEEPWESRRPSSEVGLYQLTTQMICGSDCSSETSLRSSVPSQQQTSSCRSAAPSTCSSKGRGGHGAARNSNRSSGQDGANWSNTLLAAGLEAVPDNAQPSRVRPQEGGKHQKNARWWNPFSSSGHPATAPAALAEVPPRIPARPQSELAAGPGPMLPGSIVELVGGAGPAGQQGRILVVDHAREQYKVQLYDGNIRMVKARQVRFLR